MRRAAVLSETQELIIHALARVSYATGAQLQFWSQVDQSNVSRALNMLREQDLIDTTQTRPAIYFLTTAAYAMLHQPMPAGDRYASWSVMAHACHRNAFENQMAREQGSFRFLPRLSLFKQGLHPAHGEHAAVDAAGKTWFVLLDDYMMASDRIARSWTRRHTPSKKYWNDPTGRVWREVANRYVVVTTSPRQADRHADFIKQSEFPADVMCIAALWSS
jgi:hypothetical protein